MPGSCTHFAGQYENDIRDMNPTFFQRAINSSPYKPLSGLLKMHQRSAFHIGKLAKISSSLPSKAEISKGACKLSMVHVTLISIGKSKKAS